MKKLKRILLINWLYFSKQMLEVGDINFLTGKNGAGKSTVIDALQIVLLGELNSRIFNQAANERSQRTLDGYLRADMDDSSPVSRRGKDFSSYIACEFFDDIKGLYFTAGIVFDCRADNSRQERFFLYDGPLPENCFLETAPDGQKSAMDISALRISLKQQYGPRQTLYDSHKQYRIDLLAKWNVHNEQVCRMLKKAVSFRPIVDIQKFITENICDIPDKPDIQSMQQNIRDYKRHEELAKRQEEKLSALQEIARLYREMQSALDRWQLHSFLVLWAEKEDLEGQINRYRNEQEDCRQEVRQSTVEIEQTQQSLDQKRCRKDELIADRAKSDVYQEENRLRTAKSHLEQEARQLSGRLQSMAVSLKREAQVLCRLCRQLGEQPERSELAPVLEAANAVQAAYSIFCDCDDQVFAMPLSAFETAQAASARFVSCLRDAAYLLETRLSDLEAQQDEKKSVLLNLQKNIKDYPKELLRLKERLAAGLEQYAHQPVSVEILADLLEISPGEEEWRGALEGYLNTQKFYLLVPPEYYQQALHLYDEIKYEFGGRSFGLTDIGKLREKERIVVWDDSLAKKVETSNELARSYIDYLLGRVVCCSHVSQLRRHKTAITPAGMVYQNYVARPLSKERMEDAFIGRHAVALRMERIGREIDMLQSEIDMLKPLCGFLAQHKSRDNLLTRQFVQGSIAQCQADHLRGLELEKELGQLMEQLSHLDLFWLEEISRQIKAMEGEIKALEQTVIDLVGKRQASQSRIKHLEDEKLPELYRQMTKKEDLIAEQFTPTFQEKTGVPRYQQELKRLKRAAVVAKNFGDQLIQRQNERDTAQRQLIKAREIYVSTFQPCSFRVDTMDNDEFDKERRTLEESELPRFREKIRAARESAVQQFQSDFLAKLKDSIQQVQEQVKSLNKALKQAEFGTDRYQFRVDRNPDYGEYYDMIMAPEQTGEGGLFALTFQQKYGPLVEQLFQELAASDDTQLNQRRQSELQQKIESYTDFRTYLKFDLETTDQNGSRQLLSRTLNTKSGGETQTPFYIAVLASFAQLYQTNNLSTVAGNTVRLVVFDEAFNKMDSDRIIESVRLLRKMNLQAIICTPPDKLSDIMPLADKTLLVTKEKYKMHVMSYGKEIGTHWSET